MLARSLDLAWVERRRDTRALTITDEGQRGFAETFGVLLAADAGA
jgi:hypothetical protein